MSPAASSGHPPPLGRIPLTLLTVGKLKGVHKAYEPLLAEYAQRLSAYCQLSMLEVAEETIRPTRTEAQTMEAEAQRLLPHMQRARCVVALSERGKRYTSPQFAQALLAHWQAADSFIGAGGGGNPPKRGLTSGGQPGMLWIVGGPLGLHATVLERATWVVSLSDMTFPHPMVRLLVLEQLYRAFRILHGQPYHK